MITRVAPSATGLGTLGIGEFVPNEALLPTANAVSVTMGGRDAVVKFAGGLPSEYTGAGGADRGAVSGGGDGGGPVQ